MNGPNAEVVNALETPTWESAEPNLSTSPLAPGQQHSQCTSVRQDKISASESQHSTISSDYTFLTSNAMMMSKQKKHLDNVIRLHGPLKQAKASKTEAKARDGWDVPSNDSSDYEPAGGRRDRKAAKNEQRNTTKLGPASVRSRSVKAIELPVVEDDDESVDEWAPAKRSKILEEHCNARKTRRRGSAGLVEGLLKRKRPRKETDLESGSGTEASVLSKRARVDVQKRKTKSQRPSSSAVIVDLTKVDVVLSESQKMEYEILSNGTPCSVECPSLPLGEEGQRPESSADNSQQLDTIRLQASGEALVTEKHNLATSVNSASQASSGNLSVPQARSHIRSTNGLQSPESNVSQDQGGVGTTAVTLKRISQDESQPSERANPDMSPRTHEAKPKEKRKRGRPPGKSKGNDSQKRVSTNFEVDRDVLNEDIGLPPELYKPRPSRSRGVRSVDPVLVDDDDNDAGSVEPLRSRDHDDGRGDDTANANEEVKPSKGKRGRKKKVKPSTTEDVHILEPGNETRQDTSRADAVNVHDHDEPRQLDAANDAQQGNDLFVPKSDPSPTPPTNSTHPKDSIPNKSTQTSKTDPRTASAPITKDEEEDKKVPLAESSTNTPAKNIKQSPLKDSSSSGGGTRVPYRVGLSRRVRIQSLLSSVVKK